IRETSSMSPRPVSIRIVRSVPSRSQTGTGTMTPEWTDPSRRTMSSRKPYGSRSASDRSGCAPELRSETESELSNSPVTMWWILTLMVVTSFLVPGFVGAVLVDIGVPDLLHEEVVRGLDRGGDRPGVDEVVVVAVPGVLPV